MTHFRPQNEPELYFLFAHFYISTLLYADMNLLWIYTKHCHALYAMLLYTLHVNSPGFVA